MLYNYSQKNKKTLGRVGEDLVVKYLISKKYIILNRNYRLGHLEVDIIASLKKELVFFEVKTRHKRGLENDSESLKKGQLFKLKKAISFYCYQKKINLEKASLDLIVVMWKSGEFKLRHYKNILF